MTIDPRAASHMNRIPANSPTHIAEDIKMSFALLSGAKEKIAGIRANQTLSSLGQSAEIAKTLRDGHLGHLGQIRRRVANELALAKKERTDMRDRVTKAETFSEGRKVEVRQWFRGLPEKERRAMAIETRDPLIIEAIATAPHYLSGIQPDIWEAAVGRVVEEQNGERLEILEARERGYAELGAVGQVVDAEIIRAAGLSPRDVEIIAA